MNLIKLLKSHILGFIYFRLPKDKNFLIQYF